MVVSFAASSLPLMFAPPRTGDCSPELALLCATVARTSPASAPPYRPRLRVRRRLLFILGFPERETELWTAGFGTTDGAVRPSPAWSHSAAPNRRPEASIELGVSSSTSPAPLRAEPTTGAPNSVNSGECAAARCRNHCRRLRPSRPAPPRRAELSSRAN